MWWYADRKNTKGFGIKFSLNRVQCAGMHTVLIPTRGKESMATVEDSLVQETVVVVSEIDWQRNLPGCRVGDWVVMELV